MSILSGIRVVDFTRYLSGPTLTMLLGDLGADVVKIEALPVGDPARQSGPFADGESIYFMAPNRNKRSLALNLRSSEGLNIAKRLAGQADVVVQNFRPGTVEAMGLAYAELATESPRLVYCNISGFGRTAVGQGLPGFDQTAQAMSGLMSVTGTPDTGPLRTGIAVADSATGVFGAVAVLAALFDRERTGVGQEVDCSLMQSMLFLMSYQAQKYLTLGVIPGQDGNDHPLMFPQGTFKTQDGLITIASGNEKMWRALAVVIGIGDLVEDPRFHDNANRMANRAELRKLIERALAARGRDAWLRIIGDAGIPCSPVLNVGEALEHPVAKALNMVATVKHSTLGEIKVLGASTKVNGMEEWLKLPPPTLGEHSEEVLRELGYSRATVRELVAKGVTL